MVIVSAPVPYERSKAPLNISQTLYYCIGQRTRTRLFLVYFPPMSVTVSPQL